MKYTMFATLLLLAQNVFAQSCDAMLQAFLEHRSDLETAGQIANDMYDNRCWGWNTQPQNPPGNTDCETLAVEIIEGMQRGDDPLLKISGIKYLDKTEMDDLKGKIAFARMYQPNIPVGSVNEPAPDSTRMIDCFGTARFSSGNWHVQFYLDRYEDGDEFWGLNPLQQR